MIIILNHVRLYIKFTSISLLYTKEYSFGLFTVIDYTVDSTKYGQKVHLTNHLNIFRRLTYNRYGLDSRVSHSGSSVLSEQNRGQK